MLTRLYEQLLMLLAALLPMLAFGYIALFQNPTLLFHDHTAHEVAILAAVLQSSFIAFVTWRCYLSSGEPLLRWLTLSFLGFTLIYAPHGVFTRLSDHHMALFLLYGPVSRCVMAACLLAGILSFGKDHHLPEERTRKGFWLRWIAFFVLIDILVAWLTLSVPEVIQPVRLAIEGFALLVLLVGIALIYLRHMRSWMMLVYIIVLIYFTQSSLVFIIAKPWNHLWWLAHLIGAAGFTILSYGVVRAFHTTRDFSLVFSQEEVLKQLAAAKERAEAALARQQEMQGELVQAEKLAALGGLVAGVAHEINTPVGITLSAATHLEAETQKADRAYQAGELTEEGLAEYFATARQAVQLMTLNSQRAADLIHGFKQVAVDRTGGEQRRFDLATYIDEVLLSLRSHLKKSRIEITVNCPAELTLDSLPGALSQVLTNLIMNSLVHAFEPDQVGHIEITANLEENDQVRLVYRDDGRGIPPELHAKVFEPFFTTRRSKGGSGLGLHIVHTVVTQSLKGSLTLASHPDQGTQFTLCLPRILHLHPERQTHEGHPAQA